MQTLARILAVIVVLAGSLSTAAAAPHKRIVRETESGKIVGYKTTPLLPATGNKYHVHDPDRPLPEHVETGEPPAAPAPSGAIVLFDGTDLTQWKPSSWKVSDGYLEAGTGSLETKQAFGNCRLHIEWMAPTSPPLRMMSRGNSGIFFMGLYEIQIFDSHPSHPEQIYADGQTAAIYGQTPPLVNACRLPGQWQSFDIDFTAPIFRDGKLNRQAQVTMQHNGIEVHKNQPIMGPTTPPPHHPLPLARRKTPPPTPRPRQPGALPEYLDSGAGIGRAYHATLAPNTP